MNLGPLAIAVLVQGVPTADSERPPVTVVVTPGAQYPAGWLHRLLFGTKYRDLWGTPLRVEVLDLTRFAGGLTPLHRGGFGQTSTLHFRGADGRRYVFRSVDKDPSRGLKEELRGTFVDDIVQDQVSALQPFAPVVVDPLLEAAGVLHARHRPVVMPDDPRLGEFRGEFAGTLGMFVERPDEGTEGAPGFAGSRRIVETERLLERLERNPRHQVEAREFLKARLLDLYVGDRDRHPGQWRWASLERGDSVRWHPVPEDRDQAFVGLDGLMMWVVRRYEPKFVGFTESYPDIQGLAWNGLELDRRFLVHLPKPVWDSVAGALEARLTDSVITAAVRQLPAEYYARTGAYLERALMRRRERLGEVAARFYTLVTAYADIHATDDPDTAQVDRLQDGRTSVQLTARGSTYFHRIFDPRETREIRLYLHGGNDRVVVRGRAPRGGPTVRVVGGGGDDEFVDSTSSGSTRLYDHRGDNRVVAGTRTGVDARPYEAPRADPRTRTYSRDWGSRLVPLLSVSFASDIGLFAGGGAMRTAYGFRQQEYRSRLVLRAGYATAAASYLVEVAAEGRPIGGSPAWSLRLRASGIDVQRFYGFGNETPDTGSTEFYRVAQRTYRIEPALALRLGRATRLSIGPVFAYAETDARPGTFLVVTGPYYGAGRFAELGGVVGLRVDTRDTTAAARQGVLLDVEGSVRPAAFDVTSTFGAVRGTAALHAGPLALRVGGAKVWGTAPFHAAAYVGGPTTVRGFAEHRFAGDAALFGNTEVRVPVAKVHVVLPADLGVFGLADAGRVFRAGESSDRWHAAVGGGLWLSFLNRANTLTVAAASSPERTAVYFRAGFLF